MTECDVKCMEYNNSKIANYTCSALPTRHSMLTDQAHLATGDIK